MERGILFALNGYTIREHFEQQIKPTVELRDIERENIGLFAFVIQIG